jgi:hypothetical protein
VLQGEAVRVKVVPGRLEEGASEQAGRWFMTGKEHRMDTEELRQGVEKLSSPHAWLRSSSPS